MRIAFSIAMMSFLTASASALAIADPNQPLQDRLDQANTPEARQAIERFGTCTAKLQPGEAKRLLAMDFTSTGYRTGLRLLATETERKCAYGSIGRGKMRSSNLLFSGAMAEALLEADSTPLNSRLARSANARVSSYSPTDTVAQCLARSLPDQVATRRR